MGWTEAQDGPGLAPHCIIGSMTQAQGTSKEAASLSLPSKYFCGPPFRTQIEVIIAGKAEISSTSLILFQSSMVSNF